MRSAGRFAVVTLCCCVAAAAAPGSRVTSAGSQTAASASQDRRPAVPLEPVAAVLDAFRTFSIVGLGEPHGNEQAHSFRLALLRDPRFSAIVDDIVVEFGSAKYQDVIDRFVRGDAVPDQELRQVWQNTTVAGTLWDRPIYEEFFRAVRAVNASLRPGRRLRVLLGDPPIDWDRVGSWDALREWQKDRSGHAAALIKREVLGKDRRALVVYGDVHLWRHTPSPGIVSQLERAGETRAFTVSINVERDLRLLQADAASWPVPSLAMVDRTEIGADDFGAYANLPDDLWPEVRVEQQFDALLYLGPPSSMTLSQPDPRNCADAAYMEMRLRRMALLPDGPGQTQRLRRYCAALGAKGAPAGSRDVPARLPPDRQEVR
jgi:hypothetical protein